MNEEYKCILSIGIRCFTEIFLKELELKNFSSPFDGLFLSSINDIIYLLEHKIEEVKLIHTQNDEKYKSYNEKWGYRSLHKKLDNYFFDKKNYIDSSYHYATFPHHNLKDKKKVDHFKRCFDRFDIIEKNKIKTLFCLFLHPKYPGYKKVTNNDIEILSNYLKNKYNCHLLVIYFFRTNSNEKYSLLKKTDNYSIYKINNNSWNFIDIKYELTSIFKNFNIKNDNLINYNYFNLNTK
jgi:hypothetical protein